MLCNISSVLATYETNVKITDQHGEGISGSPVLQFSIQLFGENGYTNKLPIEIEAIDSKQQEIDFKRKIQAADIGWVRKETIVILFTVIIVIFIIIIIIAIFIVIFVIIIIIIIIIINVITITIIVRDISFRALMIC